jgi:hypothetical protein
MDKVQQNITQNKCLCLNVLFILRFEFFHAQKIANIAWLRLHAVDNEKLCTCCRQDSRIFVMNFFS